MTSDAMRDHLLTQLIQLDAEVPEMRRRFYEHAAFLHQFEARGEIIRASACAEDVDWVMQRLEAILTCRLAGKRPSTMFFGTEP